jgi:hypothetical protein
MNKIFSSASKIVFVLMALAVIGLSIVKIVEAKDFIMLASMAFTFYFTKSLPAVKSE